jgi:hypothetical protein
MKMKTPPETTPPSPAAIARRHRPPPSPAAIARRHRPPPSPAAIARRHRPPPSPAAIARAVPKPAALVAAEQELGSLRGERETVMDEIRALAQQRGDREAERRLAALQSRREALEVVIREARKRRFEALEPHLKRVNSALSPVARDAAARILTAASELDAALQLGIEIVDAGRLDIDAPGLNPHQFAAFERFAEQLARR